MFSEEPELEICASCGEERDVFEFLEDGSNLYASFCQPCRRRHIRTWVKDHPKEVKAHSLDHMHRRRADKYGNLSESIDKMKVWERDSGICWICGGPAELEAWHLEHKIPLSKGGSHTYDNVAVSHPKCNIAKGSKVLC